MYLLHTETPQLPLVGGHHESWPEYPNARRPCGLHHSSGRPSNVTAGTGVGDRLMVVLAGEKPLIACDVGVGVIFSTL